MRFIFPSLFFRFWLGLFFALSITTWQNIATANDELLEVDQAFQLQPITVEQQNFKINWKISEGYHLYKKRIQISSDNLTLGNPQFSPSKLKDDPIFGKTDVFETSAQVTQPFSGDVSQTTLTIRYQGCATELGVCYPPQTQKITLDLPSQTPPTNHGATGGFNALGGLSDLFSNTTTDEPELLSAEQAFVFSHQQQNGELVFEWQIAPGYHLYRDKIKVTLIEGQAKLDDLRLPEAKQIDDPVFGQTYVYQDQVRVSLVPSEVSDKTQIELQYQGCSAELGVCYPPEKHIFSLSAADFKTATETHIAANPAKSDLSETDQIADTLKNSSLWVILGTFFLFGLLLALTPCIFPMIPILSSIIVGQGENLSTRKAFIMSVVYVLSMSITYTLAGVLAGLFGENLQVAFQNPWIIGSFSLIFVALAFSMFGFYELKLPNSLQTKLSNLSNKQEGGTLTGVAIMGFLSALIVGPCVAPPLAGALIYIGQTGDALLGGAALFVMSLGMGAPLLLLGLSAGKLLPRAGVWMNQVTRVFGVMMLGLAIWMASRILPVEITNLLWATLLIGSAIFLGALESTKDKTGWQKTFQTLGYLMLFYGSLILIGLASGSQSLLKPLETFKGNDVSQQAPEGLVFQKVKTLAEFEAQLAQAKQNGQTVMLDFYADWCVSCKEMENITFVDSQVIRTLNNTLLLKADVTANDADDKTLMKAFGIIGPPAILFFKDGEEQKAQRVVGFKNPEAFLKQIQTAFN